jgi:hypothetical protein
METWSCGRLPVGYLDEVPEASDVHRGRKDREYMHCEPPRKKNKIK